MVGDFALQGLASGSEVAILEGITSAFNSIQRRIGFEQAVAEAGMDIVTLQSGGGIRLRPPRLLQQYSLSFQNSTLFLRQMTVWHWVQHRLSA